MFFFFFWGVGSSRHTYVYAYQFFWFRSIHRLHCYLKSNSQWTLVSILFHRLEVHCRYGNYESFGEGDLKEAGVKKFFATHVCNHLCKKMKLRPVSEYDFIPPKATVHFPGISDAFLKQLTAQTLKTVRTKYGLAESWHALFQRPLKIDL